MSWRRMGGWRCSCASSTSALDRGELRASLQSRFAPRGKIPRHHWVASWMSSRNSFERWGEEKNILPLPGIETPIPRPSVDTPTELSLL
jgi:hypothetical protein